MFSGDEYLLKTTRLRDKERTDSLSGCVRHGLVRRLHLDHKQGLRHSSVPAYCADPTCVDCPALWADLLETSYGVDTLSVPSTSELLLRETMAARQTGVASECTARPRSPHQKRLQKIISPSQKRGYNVNM